MNKDRTIITRAKRKLLRILRDKNILKTPIVYDGSTLVEQKIKLYKENDIEIPCICFEWDNTPRHKQRGYVIRPYNKDLFFRYLACVQEKDYLFINAWNEWAEGMMLEPTERDGFKYLEWISEWVTRNANEIDKKPL